MKDGGALILVVEDEDQIAQIIQAYLEREGYRVVRAANGPDAVRDHRRLNPDLVVMDVKLPQMDGFQALGAIRAIADTPVIMVTALGEEHERLAGLRVGADDYVVKPFNPVELVARVAAVLRRTRGPSAAPAVRVGPLEIDSALHLVSVRADSGEMRHIDVTATQFRLLEYLARSSPRVLSRSALMEACMPEGDPLERTIDSHLSKLRRRLDEAGAGALLEAVRGVGYRLILP